MNTNDNVFFSYLNSAVLIDDSPSASATQPAVVYWDEIELDSTESNSASRPRLRFTRVGFNGALYSQQCQSSKQQRAQTITRRLVA